MDICGRIHYKVRQPSESFDLAFGPFQRINNLKRTNDTGRQHALHVQTNHCASSLTPTPQSDYERDTCIAVQLNSSTSLLCLVPHRNQLPFQMSAVTRTKQRWRQQDVWTTQHRDSKSFKTSMRSVNLILCSYHHQKDWSTCHCRGTRYK